MSHHFDTPTAREDARINLCDFYLFRGQPGRAVMVMTVNPDAGLSAPKTFRDEGLYAFRFDLNKDAREEVTFKIQFGAVEHEEKVSRRQDKEDKEENSSLTRDGHDDDDGNLSDSHKHVQKFEVRRAVGTQALAGSEGELIISGFTESVVTTADGISFFAGLAPDMFAGDATALGAFRKSFNEGRYDPEVFKSGKNYFAGRNVTAIVLEVPCPLIGSGEVQSWATISLIGHAPEVQVSRWGLPLITNIFMPDMEMRENYNRSMPSVDRDQFSTHVQNFVEHLITLAGSSDNPKQYARLLAERILPTMLPYELGSQPNFAIAKFNGRALTDDAMDVMLSLSTNSQLGDGVAPDAKRTRDSFPYFGPPFTASEQTDVTAHGPQTKK